MGHEKTMLAIPSPQLYMGAFSVYRRESEMEGARVGDMIQDATTAPLYVPPDKVQGELTPYQEQANENRTRYVEILASKSRAFFYVSLPPPPDAHRMAVTLTNNGKTATHIAQKYHVRTPPFGSQVAGAYQRVQSSALFSPVPSANSARMA